MVPSDPSIVTTPRACSTAGKSRALAHVETVLEAKANSCTTEYTFLPLASILSYIPSNDDLAMFTFVCAICLDTLENKITMSTTCGHIFCSECATFHFAGSSICPSCRRAQTFEQLIRLYPGHRQAANESSDMPMPQRQDMSLMQPEPAPVPQHDVALLRIPLRLSPHFPWTRAGVPPATDKDHSPLFLGIAAFKNGMHPCKVRPANYPMLWVSYGGKEYQYRGVGYLLPFDPVTMEWVPAFDGRIPTGRRPVDGGHERAGGQKLYHALAVVDGIATPGKTGAHIVSGHISTVVGTETHRRLGCDRRRGPMYHSPIASITFATTKSCERARPDIQVPHSILITTS